MAPASPTVARWELALRLKRRREELGLTVKQITDELGFTRNYWSQVEHEKTVLAADKLTALGALFRFDDATLAELHELRTVARQRGWWADYADQLDDEMQRFFGLEQGATAIRNFESLLIPGLLQTERYARSVFESDPGFRPVDVDRLVEMRLRRQALLDGPNALRADFLISEAALHQHVNEDGTVQRDQLRYMVDAIATRSATLAIHVIPFTQPLGPLVSSSTLILMRFSGPHVPTVLWQEGIRPVKPTESSDEVHLAELSFDTAWEASLSVEESVDILQKTATAISKD